MTNNQDKEYLLGLIVLSIKGSLKMTKFKVKV